MGKAIANFRDPLLLLVFFKDVHRTLVFADAL